MRASVESLDVSAANGNTAVAAPGFWDSLDEAAKTAAEDFFRMGPVQPEFGVKRYEVLDAVEDANSVTVTVCTYNQQVGHAQIGTGAYEFGGTGPFSAVITFDRIGDGPPAQQRGAEILPLAEKFGDWRTKSWKLGHFPDGAPCTGRELPGVEPGSWPQTRGAGPYVTDRLPTSTSYPGWPKSGA
ncbi:hypothetical protein ACRCUN_32145 [Mycobacterium sp. LTG2003]